MTPSVTARVLVPIILIEFCQKVLNSSSNLVFLAFRDFSSERKRLPHTSPVTKKYMRLRI